MKNLGKILVLFLIPISLFSNVIAKLDSNNITKGDIATLNLVITGDDIKKPNVLNVCGYDIVSSASKTSVTMINGDMNKNYVLSYEFMPLKSCEIEPIKVVIDGKEYETKKLKLKVSEAKSDKNSNFILSLQTDKKSVLVGESFDVELLFKQKSGSEALDSKFTQPTFKGFWIKNQTKSSRYKDNGFEVTKIVYTLSAQRVGQLSISAAKISIASRSVSKDGWGAWMQNIKWKTYFSNELNIDVKPLPKSVKYIGDFKIVANVDKTVVDANEPLNLTLKIEGEGNLEDMDTFKPTIDGVNIFDEKINIDSNKLTQKMAFVSDRDFVIKPFVLKYFDIKTKHVKVIKTKEILVKVNNAKDDKELTIKRDEVESNTQNNIQIKNTQDDDFFTLSSSLVFLVGLIVGAFVALIKPWNFLNRDKKEKSLVGFNGIHDEKKVLIKLLPYKDEDEDVKKIVDALEKNIYSNQNEKIDIKVLKRCLKSYDK